MIENGIISWLVADTALIAELGGESIYLHSAPTTTGADGAIIPDATKMPWVIITNSGGKRKKDSSITTEERDTLTLYVDAAQRQFALLLANMVVARLDNYRGNLYNLYGEVEERDTFIECDPPRDIDGFQGSVRYVIAVYVRFRRTTNYPR